MLFDVNNYRNKSKKKKLQKSLLKNIPYKYLSYILGDIFL